MKDTNKAGAEQSEIGLSLEELIRRGARELIQRAIEVEVQELLAEYGNVRTLRGQQAVVRNGYLPAREILTSVGNVQVKMPKVRDRAGAGGEVQLRPGAAVRASFLAHVGGAAVAVLEGDLDRRYARGSDGAGGRAGQGPECECRLAAEGRVGGGVRRLDEARAVLVPPCLLVGGRHPYGAAPGRRCESVVLRKYSVSSVSQA